MHLMIKKCMQCFQDKTTENYEHNGKRVIRNICKSCRSRKGRAYYKSNREMILLQKKEYQKEQKKENPQYELSAQRRYTKAKASAKNRKLDFDLSLSEYTELIAGNCFYCNKETLFIESGIGLDRVNSDKGYLLNNIVPCCGDCNTIKMDFTIQELKEILPKMLKAIESLNF